MAFEVTDTPSDQDVPALMSASARPGVRAWQSGLSRTQLLWQGLGFVTLFHYARAEGEDEMNRYVVLYTGWVGEEAVTIAGWTGRLRDSFASRDSAEALALRRMAYGDLSVVVVDNVKDELVFPRKELAGEYDGEASGIRVREAGPRTEAYRRVKSTG